MEQQRKDPIAGLALFISVIFHPLLMPSLFFFILLQYVPFVLAPWNDEGKYMLWGLVWIFTFAFPLIACFLLFYTGDRKLSEFLHMYNGRDRVKPFLLVGCIYLTFCYMIQQQLKLNSLLVIVLGIMGLTILISGIISLYWKVSIHSIALGGMLGFLYFINEWYAEGSMFSIILTFIVITGIVISARLYLLQHTQAQVYVGFLAGLILSISGLFLFR